MKHNELRTQPVLFVSHSGDEEFLGALRRYCTQLEVLVSQWVEMAGSGVSLAEKIRSDMRRADLVLVVLSKRSLGSFWVHQEIGLASGLGKTILPVRVGEEVALPGLLNGLCWIDLATNSVEETALRVAVRISEILSQEMVRKFTNYRDYCEWWKTIREEEYTNGVCLWAARHDLWSWFSESRGQREGIKYRTLLRGASPFDQATTNIHFGGDEIVIGIQELSALMEVHIFGNLTVESYYTPEFAEEIETVLTSNATEVELRKWYSEMIGKPRKIEVRLSMDKDRADAQRESLTWLYERNRYRRNPP